MKVVGVLLVLVAIGIIVGLGVILQSHLAKRRAILESEGFVALKEARKQLLELQYADWRVRQIDAYVRDQVSIHGENLDRAMLLSIINRKPTAQEAREIDS